MHAGNTQWLTICPWERQGLVVVGRGNTVCQRWASTHGAKNQCYINFLAQSQLHNTFSDSTWWPLACTLKGQVAEFPSKLVKHQLKWFQSQCITLWQQVCTKLCTCVCVTPTGMVRRRMRVQWLSVLCATYIESQGSIALHYRYLALSVWITE